ERTRGHRHRLPCFRSGRADPTAAVGTGPGRDGRRGPAASRVRRAGARRGGSRRHRHRLPARCPAPPRRRRRPDRARPRRRARRSGRGARRPGRRGRAGRAQRPRPRGAPRRDGAAAGRRPGGPAGDGRRGRADRGPGGGRPARRAPPDGARRPRRDRGSAHLSRGVRRPPHAARPDRGAGALVRRPGHRLPPLGRGAGQRFLGSVRGRRRPPPGRHLPPVHHPPLSPLHAGHRDHAGGADADSGRHGPGGRRTAFPEICAGVRGGGRRQRPAGRHDHRRRRGAHHPGGSQRGRPAAVRRGRGRHQRAGDRKLQGAGPLADRQPPDRAGRLHRDPHVRRQHRAAGDPGRADADRRGGGRQCRHADAGGDGAGAGDQPADRVQPLAGGRAGDAGGVAQRSHRRRPDRGRRVTDPSQPAARRGDRHCHAVQHPDRGARGRAGPADAGAATRRSGGGQQRVRHHGDRLHGLSAVPRTCDCGRADWV
ncbi:MAG: Mg/Co/Ni transporter MgtE, CBS domain-containing, partial [uncultured Sphingomonas sp.]